MLRPPRCCGPPRCSIAMPSSFATKVNDPSTANERLWADMPPPRRALAPPKKTAKTSTSPRRNILLNDSRLRPRPASLPGGDPVGVIPLLPPQAKNATLRHQSSFPRAPATSPTSLAPPSSPQKTMPEKKVLQRPSSATAHHVNGIVPDDALPPPPPAPAAAAMEEARQRRRSPPTSPRHAQTPTRASREGANPLAQPPPRHGGHRDGERDAAAIAAAATASKGSAGRSGGRHHEFGGSARIGRDKHERICKRAIERIVICIAYVRTETSPAHLTLDAHQSAESLDAQQILDKRP